MLRSLRRSRRRAGARRLPRGRRANAPLPPPRAAPRRRAAAHLDATAARAIDAFLEDHALLVDALLSLYQADFDPRLGRARRAPSPTRMLARFWDERAGPSTTPPRDGERAGRPPARRLRQRDPLRQLRGGSRAPSPRGAHGRDALRGASPCGCWRTSRASLAEIPQALRRASSARSTSTSRPPARWRWSGRAGRRRHPRAPRACSARRYLPDTVVALGDPAAADEIADARPAPRGPGSGGGPRRRLRLRALRLPPPRHHAARAAAELAATAGPLAPLRTPPERAQAGERGFQEERRLVSVGPPPVSALPRGSRSSRPPHPRHRRRRGATFRSWWESVPRRSPSSPRRGTTPGRRVSARWIPLRGFRRAPSAGGAAAAHSPRLSGGGAG